MLLSRLENEQTGEVLPEEFKAQIPQERLDQTNQAAQVLGQSFITSYPSLANVKPMSDDLVQTMLNRSMSIVLHNNTVLFSLETHFDSDRPRWLALL